MTFGSKVILKEMILYSGASGNFVGHGRPATLRLVFSDGHSDTITPQDTGKPQTLSISHAIGVTSVRIEISSVYPGLSGKDVAVTEIDASGLGNWRPSPACTAAIFATACASVTDGLRRPITVNQVESRLCA